MLEDHPLRQRVQPIRRRLGDLRVARLFTELLHLGPQFRIVQRIGQRRHLLGRRGRAGLLLPLRGLRKVAPRLLDLLRRFLRRVARLLIGRLVRGVPGLVGRLVHGLHCRLQLLPRLFISRPVHRFGRQLKLLRRRIGRLQRLLDIVRIDLLQRSNRVGSSFFKVSCRFRIKVLSIQKSPHLLADLRLPFRRRAGELVLVRLGPRRRGIGSQVVFGQVVRQPRLLVRQLLKKARLRLGAELQLDILLFRERIGHLLMRFPIRIRVPDLLADELLNLGDQGERLSLHGQCGIILLRDDLLRRVPDERLCLAHKIDNLRRATIGDQLLEQLAGF